MGCLVASPLGSSAAMTRFFAAAILLKAVDLAIPAAEATALALSYMQSIS